MAGQDESFCRSLILQEWWRPRIKRAVRGYFEETASLRSTGGWDKQIRDGHGDEDQ